MSGDGRDEERGGKMVPRNQLYHSRLLGINPKPTIPHLTAATTIIIGYSR